MKTDRDGVSRVVLLYREENFEAAVAAFRDALGIGDLGEPIAPPGMGLRIALSWDTGIELLAPCGEGLYAEALRAHLDKRGEGMFGIVYRVASLDAAEGRAAAAGYAPLGERIDCFASSEAWRERFDVLLERNLPLVAGTQVTLIEMEAKA